MNISLNLDQHTLCVNSKSELMTQDGDLVIYDKIKQTTITVPQNSDVLHFLLQVPATVIDEVPAQSNELNNNSIEVTQVTLGQQCSESASEESASAISVSVDDEVWVKNAKPTARDREASDALIKLVGCDRFKSLLKDKTSKKKNVWSEIGKEMLKLGFVFGTRDPGVVCAQKWRNMESKTINFIQNAGPKCTGAGKIQKPSFFDDVRDVIKDSAKASPVNLLDSMSASQCSTSIASSVIGEALASSKRGSEEMLSDEEEEKLRTDSASSSGPFLKVQASTKPKKKKVDNSAILEFLKKEAEEKQRQNQTLLNLLEKKMEQDKEAKSQMLSILAKLVEKA